MEREAWRRVFRGMVVSAASGLSGCGQISTLGDAAPLDASSESDSSDAADADIVWRDSSPVLVDVADCLLTHADTCTPAEYDLACVLKKLGITDGGAPSSADLARINAEREGCYVVQDRVYCGQPCPGLGGGRPSRAVIEGTPHDMATLGGFFAECASSELGSVFGFEEVTRWLRSHGAPERLIVWAEQAAREEVRHTREMLEYARRHNVIPRAVRPVPSAGESIFEFARANLVDGCVAETYAALELVWMGDYAAGELRELFARTADDEVAHAGLAFEIHDWLLPQLTHEERAKLSSALHDALRQMMERASTPRASPLAELGLPPTNVASALALELAASLLLVDEHAHRCALG